jgi:WhiB family transcriptional regulator, redox-sensing transcriptional regulator
MYLADVSAKAPRRTWRSRAACQGIDPGVFFPVGSTGPAIGQIAAAKAICYACQVRNECLEFALVTRQEFGVWGGRDEEQRRRAARTEHRAAASSELGDAGDTALS